MPRSRQLVVRADASAEIGSGHVMRCLALAQAFRHNDGQASLLTALPAPALEQRWRNEGFCVHRISAARGSQQDIDATIAFARDANAEWLVLDGYCFDAHYQRALRDAGFHVLAVDDYGHLAHYAADIVLNPNLGVEESLYANREPHTRLLLGTRYAMLRREFQSWHTWKRELPPRANKVLVTFGGSDPGHLTARAIHALQQTNVDGLEAIVLIGAANPHADSLAESVRQSNIPIRLIRNASNMPELLAWADVAISAAGSTSWEVAFMALPALLVVTAENQQGIGAHLQTLGAARNLGWHEDITSDAIARELTRLQIDHDLRQQFSDRSRELVDGYGAQRVVATMLDGVYLRPANDSDCRLLFEWTNDPSTRAASINTAPVTWDTHVEWFHARLSDQNCGLFLALDSSDEPVGQFRYDVDEDHATVSVSLAPHMRSRGRGVPLIVAGTNELFANTSATIAHAYIKPDNAASQRVFAKAGYSYERTETLRGQQLLLYVRRRNGS